MENSAVIIKTKNGVVWNLCPNRRTKNLFGIEALKWWQWHVNIFAFNIKTNETFFLSFRSTVDIYWRCSRSWRYGKLGTVDAFFAVCNVQKFVLVRVFLFLRGGRFHEVREFDFRRILWFICKQFKRREMQWILKTHQQLSELVNFLILKGFKTLHMLKLVIDVVSIFL